MPEIVAARSLCETCAGIKMSGAPRHRRDDFHAVRDLRLGPLAVEEAGEREAGHVGVARRRRGAVFVALVELSSNVVDLRVTGRGDGVPVGSTRRESVRRGVGRPGTIPGGRS